MMLGLFAGPTPFQIAPACKSSGRCRACQARTRRQDHPRSLMKGSPTLVWLCHSSSSEGPTELPAQSAPASESGLHERSSQQRQPSKLEEMTAKLQSLGIAGWLLSTSNASNNCPWCSLMVHGRAVSCVSCCQGL